jgi:hypothetical protein
MIPVDSPETIQRTSACLRSAIPPDHFHWEAIPSITLKEIIIRIIHSPEFTEVKTLREQIGILLQMLNQNDGKSHLTWKTISDFFGLNGKNMAFYHFSAFKRLSDIKSHGRPSKLTPIQNHDLIRYITSSHRTLDDCQHFLLKKFGVDIIHNTISKLLKRQGFTTIIAKPMEANRVECTLSSIENYYQKLQRLISNVPAHFIFNLDECGHDLYVVARRIRIIVSQAVKAQIHQSVYAVPRNSKRSTQLSCIAADGSYLTSMIIVPRSTLDSEIRLYGITSEKVLILHQKKALLIMLLR